WAARSWKAGGLRNERIGLPSENYMETELTEFPELQNSTRRNSRVLPNRERRAKRSSLAPRRGEGLRVKGEVRQTLRTSNIQHRTQNIDDRSIRNSFDVRCSMFGVRCFPPSYGACGFATFHPSPRPSPLRGERETSTTRWWQTRPSREIQTRQSQGKEF